MNNQGFNAEQIKWMYVGYQTNKFPLPVTLLTVSVWKIFAFIFGNVIFFTGNVILAWVTILANLHY